MIEFLQKLLAGPDAFTITVRTLKGDLLGGRAVFAVDNYGLVIEPRPGARATAFLLPWAQVEGLSVHPLP